MLILTDSELYRENQESDHVTPQKRRRLFNDDDNIDDSSANTSDDPNPPTEVGTTSDWNNMEATEIILDAAIDDSALFDWSDQRRSSLLNQCRVAALANACPAESPRGVICAMNANLSIFRQYILPAYLDTRNTSERDMIDDAYRRRTVMEICEMLCATRFIMRLHVLVFLWGNGIKVSHAPVSVIQFVRLICDCLKKKNKKNNKRKKLTRIHNFCIFLPRVFSLFWT